MYGNRAQRQERLQRIVQAVQEAGEGITQSALARLLGVSRSVINKDLVALHQHGVRLAEDEDGKLVWPE